MQLCNCSQLCAGQCAQMTQHHTSRYLQVQKPAGHAETCTPDIWSIWWVFSSSVPNHERQAHVGYQLCCLQSTYLLPSTCMCSQTVHRIRPNKGFKRTHQARPELNAHKAWHQTAVCAVLLQQDVAGMQQRGTAASANSRTTTPAMAWTVHNSWSGTAATHCNM